jgi:hypothetical protein
MMAVLKKNVDSPHKIISVTLLATGRLIMATETRMYELINNVWEPMVFADDPVVDQPDPIAPAEPAPVAETHS